MQSAVQDVDYENETDLLYAVVTLQDPTSTTNMQCNLYFINEKNGAILKTVPLPTWKPVSIAISEPAKLHESGCVSNSMDSSLTYHLVSFSG